MEVKICKLCKLEKPINEFKFIKNKYHLNYCKKCCYLKSNKDKTKETTKKWTNENKELLKDKRKVYNSLNKDKLLENRKNYYIKNKDKEIKSGYERHKKRLLVDEIYTLKYKFRTTIKNSFRHTKTIKIKSSDFILGCPINEFKTHLESKFEPWMNWDNHGLYNGTPNYGWDIDHIIPISTVKTSENVIRLNHYTNLQPLCCYINRDVKKNIIDFK